MGGGGRQRDRDQAEADRQRQTERQTDRVSEAAYVECVTCMIVYVLVLVSVSHH